MNAFLWFLLGALTLGSPMAFALYFLLAESVRRRAYRVGRRDAELEHGWRTDPALYRVVRRRSWPLDRKSSDEAVLLFPRVSPPR
ncbi:hypothetical protein Ade02nite_18920 [Paractinoplanes deccanensis]|uniref:Uncharacterized protein n=1 Tax=Paractinoplanes deccanensis TaxID=113561 RepID=A0ABQ3XZS9_9ACTN|nr:hypothetical protein [Actinoplanes deccanensis]GID73251.1 hypothetical protein Ade02nite_18920 [Actinoplanes deccanensis]